MNLKLNKCFSNKKNKIYSILHTPPPIFNKKKNIIYNLYLFHTTNKLPETHFSCAGTALFRCPCLHHLLTTVVNDKVQVVNYDVRLHSYLNFNVAVHSPHTIKSMLDMKVWNLEKKSYKNHKLVSMCELSYPVKIIAIHDCMLILQQKQKCAYLIILV